MNKVKKSVLTIVFTAIILTLLSFSAYADNLSSYTPIDSKEAFAAMADNPSGKYYLTDDIIFEPEDFKYRGDFFNNGDYYTCMDTFSGILDGCGHSIVGLKGNNAIAIANKGTIKNLCIEECDFTSGALCEENYGTVTNCKLLNSSANGIVYLNKNKVSYCFSKDSNCGICIYNEKNVSYCINYSDIESGTSSDWGSRYHVGGIACINEGTISCCGNFGNISSDDRAAGICSNVIYDAIRGTVEKCYNYGNITGDCAAGIACENNNVYECINYGEINDNYAAGIQINSYDNEVINCVNLGSVYIGDGYPICLGECVDSYYLEGVGDRNDEGIMLTAQEALKQDSFSQLDFDNTWEMTANGIRLKIENEENIGLFFYSLPKTYYYKGESFDTSGLEIICYNNLGDWEFVDDYETSGFTGEFGVNKITVTANGFSISFDITVNGWGEDSKGNKFYYRNGEKVKSWQKIDGNWYYFNARYEMLTGLQKISGKYYYLGDDGIMRTGWQKISKSWYYFNSKGVMLTGWQKLSNKWYYFNDSGVMLTGFQKIGSSTYYFNSSGAMLTGWQKISNKWYYFESSGKMAVNKAAYKIGSAFYCFDKNGVWQNTLTGWKKDAQWYYIVKGKAVTGWKKISGKWYYFDKNYANMYTTYPYYIDGSCYLFNKDGSLAGTKWYKDSGNWYYFKNGKMALGWQKISGKWYYFNDSMYYGGWAVIDGKNYYFNSDGTLNNSITNAGYDPAREI